MSNGDEIIAVDDIYGGAGRYPTSSAVLSDISASLYDYKYSYNKGILASIPTYDCEAKFFISYQGNKFQLLQSLFENIEEKFESKGRNYVIGNIKLKKLNDSQLLNQRNYSIIQID